VVPITPGNKLRLKLRRNVLTLSIFESAINTTAMDASSNKVIASLNKGGPFIFVLISNEMRLLSSSYLRVL